MIETTVDDFVSEMKDRIAQNLWHRYAPSDHIEWIDEPSAVQSEYRYVATELIEETGVAKLYGAIVEIEALCHSETRQRLLGICQRAIAEARGAA